MTVDLTTDRKLLERLTAAAAQGVSVQERRQQRVSFVYGNMPKGSAMSKQQIEQALQKIDGKDGRG